MAQPRTGGRSSRNVGCMETDGHGFSEALFYFITAKIFTEITVMDKSMAIKVKDTTQLINNGPACFLYEGKAGREKVGLHLVICDWSIG